MRKESAKLAVSILTISILILAGGVALGQTVTPTPNQTATMIPTITPTSTPTPTPTPPPTPTPTPVMSISPDPPSFNLGTLNPGESTSQIFSISNSGGGTLIWGISYDQSWITINPTSGANSGTVTISVNTADLSPGSYSGIITVTSNGGTKKGIVSLNIRPTPLTSQPTTPPPITTLTSTPVISISPDPPSFNLGTLNPGESTSQIFLISNSGSGTLTWSISYDQSWITIYPISGTNSGTVTISVNTTGLSPGSYSGIITVISNGGTKKGVVSLNIRPTALTSQPTTPTPPQLQSGPIIDKDVIIASIGALATIIAAYFGYRNIKK